MLSKKQQIWKDGFVNLDITNDHSCQKVISTLDHLVNNDPGSSFHWEEKYPNTHDMRPDVYSYDSCFIDLLFENNLPTQINELTGRRLSLYHTQIRKSYPGQSYMPWHRDTYMLEDRIVGNIPPVYKLMIYPQFEKESAPKLQVLKGSHRLWFPNQKESQFVSPGFSIFDKEIFKILDIEDVYSTNDTALFFDTSMLHNVIPNQDYGADIRLIYSFLEIDQFDDEKLANEVHARPHQIYEDLFKGS